MIVILFKKLLIHRCTLINSGEVIGTDDYGRDIVGEAKEENVPCRFDEIQQKIGFDESGIDFIFENALFFDKDVKISLDTKIRDIKDPFGMIIMEGEHRIERLTPIYDSKRLHHWEAVIQKI